MSEDEVAVLMALAKFRKPRPARAVAAAMQGISEAEAIATGSSSVVARHLLRLASESRRYVTKDYPYGVNYVAYKITAAGRAALKTASPGPRE